MAVSKHQMYGTYIDMNHPPVSTPASNSVVLHGTHDGKNAAFAVSEDTLKKHSLFIGGTGCGKTTLIYHFMNQIKRSMTQNDVMIVFDSKGDFYSKFFDAKKDAVIGNSKQYSKISEKWNIFKEVLADGWDENDFSQNIQEVSRSIFEDRVQKNSSNAFFPNAARDLLAAIICAFILDVKNNQLKASDWLYNDTLLNVMTSMPTDALIGLLLGHENLRTVLSYIEGDNGQSQGVLSEMYSVMRDILVGVFASDGKFSMREFVRQKQGRTLFIEYDLSIGSVLTPIYRLLVDLALKEALSRSAGKGNVYVFCDEFKLLPYLQHIDDAVNFGRSLGVKVFAGLQSISQLYEIYGEYRGANIAAGFSSIYAFRANDPVTRKYITDLFGDNIVLEQYIAMGNQAMEEKRNGKVVEDWELNSLKIGEAVVGLPFYPPFRFHFKEY